MRKSILIMLVTLVMVGGIGFTSCRGGTTSPGGELNWDDMPLYEGASQADKGNWAIPPEDKEWARVEWRYYKFDDTVNSVDMVSMFYRNEMPKNGWEETVWMDIQNTNWGLFSKNNDRDDAMIWISSEDGHTVFALMRASN